MHFLLCDLSGEILVLVLGDSLVVNILKEFFYILQVVFTGVVRVEGGVEVGEGSLGIQLASVLGLGNRAICILRLCNDLGYCVLSGRWTS